MLELKSQALLSLQPKAILYPFGMTLGKRIAIARKAIRPKLTQAAVAVELGVSDKAVSAWERDKDTPTPDKFRKLAEILKRDVAYLHGEDGASALNAAAVNQRDGFATVSRNPALKIIPGSDLMGEVDLPVYSIVQGGKGALVLENEPFTYTGRPKRLIGIAKGYGVRVKGNSMGPEYKENDIAFVDPTLNPRKDDPCIFQGFREDGTVEAMIKYLDRSPDSHEKFYFLRTGTEPGPVEKFTVKKADWQKVHVAVGKESGR